MFESHGPSLKESRKLEREKKLHHLRIFSGPNATAENKSWVVTHHSSDDSEPVEEHSFTDGKAMLTHIAEHAAVNDGSEGESGDNRERG